MALSILVIGIACSPIRIAEGLFLDEHFTRTENLQYGAGSLSRLDVYRPRGRRDGLPVIIFLYGGRWRGGSKDDYRLLGDAFTRRGFVVAIPEFRSFPESQFPGWVEDAAKAVQWTRSNIGRYGGDSSQIWVIGHSSGAHTVALLALDERYLRAVGLSASAVRGYVSVAGPVDTTWTEPDVQEVMGPVAGWSRTYPINFIDGTEQPILLLHGANDRTVSVANSERLASRIRARGGRARSIVYRGIGHQEIIFALSVPRLGNREVADDVVEFIRGGRRGP